MSDACSSCGTVNKDGAKFCENCGAPLAAEPKVNTIPTAAPVAAPAGVEPGFSDRVNDPEILAAVAKNRKASKIFAAILVPLPLIGFALYSLITQKMEIGKALVAGAVVSLIFLIFAVRGFLKSRATNSYEAVVTEQKTRERTERNQDHMSSYTEYITVAETSDGKKKRIVEREGGLVTAYHYLNVGDRFKYHPQFNFPYELYDKAKAPYIACDSCGTHNPVEADRCSKCNIPLLK